MKNTNIPVQENTLNAKWPRSSLLAITILALFITTFSIFAQPIVLAAPISPIQPGKSSSYGDWPTYLFDQKHSGYNKYETIINPSSAPNLKLHWTVTAGGIISTQVVVANGAIYWGSWDGFEHATNLDGTPLWSTNLGTTSASCYPNVTHGVLGTATVATVKIGGTPTTVVFVGGGQTIFYALNAATGAIIWQTQLGTPPDDEIWSSPSVYKGSIYIGIAHFFGECPSQGRVVQLDAATGTILHTFDIAPNGCTGAGVWGSVTVDPGNGTLFFGTGDPGTCSQTETYAESVVQLRVESQYVVPPSFVKVS